MCRELPWGEAFAQYNCIELSSRRGPAMDPKRPPGPKGTTSKPIRRGHPSPAQRAGYHVQAHHSGQGTTSKPIPPGTPQPSIAGRVPRHAQSSSLNRSFWGRLLLIPEGEKSSKSGFLERNPVSRLLPLPFFFSEDFVNFFSFRMANVDGSDL